MFILIIHKFVPQSTAWLSLKTAIRRLQNKFKSHSARKVEKKDNI